MEFAIRDSQWMIFVSNKKWTESKRNNFKNYLDEVVFVQKPRSSEVRFGWNKVYLHRKHFISALKAFDYYYYYFFVKCIPNLFEAIEESVFYQNMISLLDTVMMIYASCYFIAFKWNQQQLPASCKQFYLSLSFSPRILWKLNPWYVWLNPYNLQHILNSNSKSNSIIIINIIIFRAFAFW